MKEGFDKRIDARKLQTNASYFAFTATPKSKTLETFGDRRPPRRARSNTGPPTAIP